MKQIYLWRKLYLTNSRTLSTHATHATHAAHAAHATHEPHLLTLLNQATQPPQSTMCVCICMCVRMCVRMCVCVCVRVYPTNESYKCLETIYQDVNRVGINDTNSCKIDYNN